jgi:hypothetical protein
MKGLNISPYKPNTPLGFEGLIFSPSILYHFST